MSAWILLVHTNPLSASLLLAIFVAYEGGTNFCDCKLALYIHQNVKLIWESTNES